MEIDNGFALPVDSEEEMPKQPSKKSHHSNYRTASIEEENYSENFDPATIDRIKINNQNKNPAYDSQINVVTQPAVNQNPYSSYNKTRQSTESLERATNIESIIEKPPIISSIGRRAAASN